MSDPRTLVTSAAKHTGAAAMNRILNIVRGKCPKCEVGDVFESKGNIFMLRAPVMHEECPHCGHRFEIEPGFFLGAMYVSYALTIAESATGYMVARYFTTNLAPILPIIAAVIILMTFINFRYSRIIWMYIFARKGEPEG